MSANNRSYTGLIRFGLLAIIGFGIFPVVAAFYTELINFYLIKKPTFSSMSQFERFYYNWAGFLFYVSWSFILFVQFPYIRLCRYWIFLAKSPIYYRTFTLFILTVVAYLLIPVTPIWAFFPSKGYYPHNMLLCFAVAATLSPLYNWILNRYGNVLPVTSSEVKVE